MGFSFSLKHSPVHNAAIIMIAIGHNNPGEHDDHHRDHHRTGRMDHYPGEYHQHHHHRHHHHQHRQHWVHHHRHGHHHHWTLQLCVEWITILENSERVQLIRLSSPLPYGRASQFLIYALTTTKIKFDLTGAWREPLSWRPARCPHTIWKSIAISYLSSNAVTRTKTKLD